jgi:hypothetical protein
MKKWRRANPEKAREVARRFYQGHLLAERERNKMRTRKDLYLLRSNALTILGGKCNRCGFDDRRALQIDHIIGGGTKERKHNPSAIYRKIRDGQTKGYQLLCANCNVIKRVENKENG